MALVKLVKPTEMTKKYKGRKNPRKTKPILEIVPEMSAVEMDIPHKSASDCDEETVTQSDYAEPQIEEPTHSEDTGLGSKEAYSQDESKAPEEEMNLHIKRKADHIEPQSSVKKTQIEVDETPNETEAELQLELNDDEAPKCPSSPADSDITISTCAESLTAKVTAILGIIFIISANQEQEIEMKQLSHNQINDVGNFKIRVISLVKLASKALVRSPLRIIAFILFVMISWIPLMLLGGPALVLFGMVYSVSPVSVRDRVKREVVRIEERMKQMLE